MHTFQDAKIMAKALREELSRREVALSHGECLDIVARQFGLDNWNILAAKLDGAAPAGTGAAAAGASALLLPAGWMFDGSRLDYDAGVDTGTRHGSGYPALIRSRFPTDDPTYARTRSGLAALGQELDAAAYRGKRLRLQADLKAEAVIGAPTMWLQVDRCHVALNRKNARQAFSNSYAFGPIGGTAPNHGNGLGTLHLM